MTPEQLSAFISEQREIWTNHLPGALDTFTTPPENIAFIAAASAHYGQLLDTIEEQQARIIALEEELHPMVHGRVVARDGKLVIDLNDPWKID
jgi:hypothetical protein